MGSEYTSWETEPNVRGTWSILSSCTITLVLCVYTAVHLNVPATLETRAQKWQYMTGWVLLGIFAPELVAWTAWCQWSEAKKLSREMRNMKQSLEDVEKTSDQDWSDIAPLLNSWTLKHSYFVIMGGFQLRPADAVHCPDSNRQWYHTVLPYRYLPQTVLSTKGFLDFLKDGHGKKIPILAEADIDDKSKADTLAKTLACLQGSWIFVQTIGRLASHLTITELEINTLAHVLCTIAMYVFWWNKPLKIEQPIFLDNNGIEDWTFVRSGLQYNHRVWIYNSQSSEKHNLHVHTKDQALTRCKRCPGWRNGIILRRGVVTSPDEVVELMKRSPVEQSWDFVGPAHSTDPDRSDFVYAKDVTGRLLIVNQSELDFLLVVLAQSTEFLKPRSGRAVIKAEDLEFNAYAKMIKDEYVDDIMSLFATVLMSSLYGAIHATLWQHHFPTTTEMWMWRISCIIVAGTSLLMASVTAFLGISDTELNQLNKAGRFLKVLCNLVWDVETYLSYHVSRTFKNGAVIVAAGAGFTLIGVTVFCRLFLFIEAFISLRSQPQSVYQTPDWIQWLPHL